MDDVMPEIDDNTAMPPPLPLARPGGVRRGIAAHITLGPGGRPTPSAGGGGGARGGRSVGVE